MRSLRQIALVPIVIATACGDTTEIGDGDSGPAGAGGSAGTGGADGGPQGDLLNTCFDYVQIMSNFGSGCTDCVVNAQPCQKFFDPIITDEGPCGEANTCAADCGGEPPPGADACDCFVDCLQGSPPQCEEAFQKAFACMNSACGPACL